MAREINPKLIRDTHLLRRRGLKQTEIARELGISDRSVRKYLAAECPTAEEASDEMPPVGKSQLIGERIRSAAYLTHEEFELLRAEAKRQRVSNSHVMCEALRFYINACNSYDRDNKKEIRIPITIRRDRHNRRISLAA